MADTRSTIAQSELRRFAIPRPVVVMLFAMIGLFVLRPGVRAAAEEPGAPDDRGNAEVQINVQIEKEYAEKVKRYNELLKQNRYEEALLVAKQAQLLEPENPTNEV